MWWLRCSICILIFDRIGFILFFFILDFLKWLLLYQNHKKTKEFYTVRLKAYIHERRVAEKSHIQWASSVFFSLKKSPLSTRTLQYDLGQKMLNNNKLVVDPCGFICSMGIKDNWSWFETPLTTTLCCISCFLPSSPLKKENQHDFLFYPFVHHSLKL